MRWAVLIGLGFLGGAAVMESRGATADRVLVIIDGAGGLKTTRSRPAAPSPRPETASAPPTREPGALTLRSSTPPSHSFRRWPPAWRWTQLPGRHCRLRLEPCVDQQRYRCPGGKAAQDADRRLCSRPRPRPSIALGYGWGDRTRHGQGDRVSRLLHDERQRSEDNRRLTGGPP